MQALTERQQQIYDWIISYVEKYATQPSYREIGAHFGISPSGLTSQLRAMETKGLIRLSFEPGGAGQIEFVRVRFKAETVTTCQASQSG